MGRCDWIHLAEVRDQWQALLNTIIDLLVPQKSVEFLD